MTLDILRCFALHPLIRALLPEALGTLRRSLVELGMVDHEPDMTKLYTERFLPEK